MAEDERPEEPTEEPATPEGDAPEEQPAAEAPEEQPAAEETEAAEEQPAVPEPAAASEDADTDAEAPAEEPAPEQPAAEAPAEEERPPRGERPAEESESPDVVPGAHLEPDLVLDQPAAEEDEYDRYAGPEDGDSEAAATVEEESTPVPRSTIDLAADARYKATGKRKTAIARVVVKPGSGSYKINGRTLEEFFPRQTLQRTARQPLETVGYDTRMDVVARIQGGGV